MKFYHYATSEFDDLRSRVAQGKGKLFIMDRKPELLENLEGSLVKLLDKVDFRDEWSYDRSISLFIAPLPLDIANIYGGLHELWKSGEQFVEYELDLDNIPAGCAWRLVESPEKTKLLYETQDWEAVKDDKSLIAKYVKEIRAKEERMGYIGHGRESLEKVVKKFNKRTREYMEKAYKIALGYPEDGGFKKYAASVPHIMIYPGHKPVEYETNKLITLK